MQRGRGGEGDSLEQGNIRISTVTGGYRGLDSKFTLYNYLIILPSVKQNLERET